MEQERLNKPCWCDRRRCDVIVEKATKATRNHHHSRIHKWTLRKFNYAEKHIYHQQKIDQKLRLIEINRNRILYELLLNQVSFVTKLFQTEQNESKSVMLRYVTEFTPSLPIVFIRYQSLPFIGTSVRWSECDCQSERSSNIPSNIFISQELCKNATMKKTFENMMWVRKDHRHSSNGENMLWQDNDKDLNEFGLHNVLRVAPAYCIFAVYE